MKSENFELLIWRKLRGELTDTEAQMLADWQIQAPENQKIVESIEKIWRDSDAYLPDLAIDLESEFQKLRTKIAAGKSVQMPADAPMQVARGGKFSWLRAAAAVAILVAAVGLLRQFLGKQIFENQIVVAKTGVEKIQLPDGSKVWLRQGSELSFPEKFSQNSRVVRLTGEAFFEVEHDVLHPFRVEISEGSEVEVLGTSFNIFENENAATTEVLVKTGRVRFSNSESKTSAVLEAGQKSVFDRKELKIKVLPVETDNDLAWQTGGLSFENTPLSTVISDFEKFYGIEISLQNLNLAGCRFTSPRNNQPAENALQALALAFGMQVQKIAEKKFELRGGKCK